MLCLWNGICCDNALFRSLFMSQNHCWPSHLKFGETIEKPLLSMVNRGKNIQWWWYSGSKTIEKPSKAMVPLTVLKSILPGYWLENDKYCFFTFFCTDNYLQTMTFNIWAKNMQVCGQHMEFIFWVGIHLDDIAFSQQCDCFGLERRANCWSRIIEIVILEFLACLASPWLHLATHERLLTSWWQWEAHNEIILLWDHDDDAAVDP